MEKLKFLLLSGRPRLGAPASAVVGCTGDSAASVPVSDDTHVGEFLASSVSPFEGMLIGDPPAFMSLTGISSGGMGLGRGVLGLCLSTGSSLNLDICCAALWFVDCDLS